MIEAFYQAQYYIVSILQSESFIKVILLLFPFVLFLELPFYMVLILSIIKKWLKSNFSREILKPYKPLVTIVITAYSEEEALFLTLDSICEQIYNGYIETLIIIDDAPSNHKTLACAEYYLKTKKDIPHNITFRIIPKAMRGGLANSRNIGLELANGEIIMVIDADTSIENRCISQATKNFSDPNVIALSGSLRVRNAKKNILCKIQALEYKLGIELSRFGLSEMKVLNNISGAFGFFRVNMLRKIGGWLNGTAEDLDLTMRLHAYSKRYPTLLIAYESQAIAYTSVPDTFIDYYKQRLRWDGDLYFIYVRRHWRNFSLKLMGFWRTLITALYGLYYQLALPFIILIYYAYTLYKYNLGILLGITFIMYLYYLIVGVFFYLLYLVIVTDTKIDDLKLLPIVFIMPIFQLVYKVTTTLFILNEILFKGHKDTSMAPWWIIKRTK